MLGEIRAALTSPRSIPATVCGGTIFLPELKRKLMASVASNAFLLHLQPSLSCRPSRAMQKVNGESTEELMCNRFGVINDEIVINFGGGKCGLEET